MLKLLGIDVNQMVIYIAGFLIVAGLIAGGYWYWKHNVEATAALKFNNEQLEQTVKDKDQLITSMKAIDDAREKAILDLQKQKEAVDAQLKDVEDYLDSDDATKADRPSSDVLKETIRKLRASVPK